MPFLVRGCPPSGESISEPCGAALFASRLLTRFRRGPLVRLALRLIRLGWPQTPLEADNYLLLLREMLSSASRHPAGVTALSAAPKALRGAA